MAKSIKLDALVLLRVVAEENHQEVFFGSMQAGIKREKGYMYFIDNDGNVKRNRMKNG